MKISGRLMAAVVVCLWGAVPRLYADSGTVIKFADGQTAETATMTFTSEGIVTGGTTVGYAAFTFDVQRSAISGSIGSTDEPEAKTSVAVDASGIARTYPNPVLLGEGDNPEVKSLANAVVTFSMPSYTYTGTALTPPFTVTDGTTVLTAGTHYSTTYSNNVHTGQAAVTLTGLGDYSGTTKTAVFYIGKATLTVTADNATRVYGEANPAFTYHLSGFVGSDTESVMTVAPTVATAATAASAVGTYDITPSGGVAADYSFSCVPGTLTITPRDMSTATVVFDQERYPYTGSAVTPGLTVSLGETVLTPNADYTLACSNNTQVGTATAVIAGTGNYTGQIDTTFVIYQEQLLKVIINGEEIAPKAASEGTQTFSSPYGVVLAQRLHLLKDAVWLYITPETGYTIGVDNIKLTTEYTMVSAGKNPTLMYRRPEGEDVTLTITFTDASTVGLDGLASDSGELRVFDTRGLLLTTATVSDAADMAACLAKLPAGLYILRINNQTIKIQKK